MIATCSNFSAAALYAINQLGKQNLSFKKEQIFSIVAIHNGKDVFVWLPIGFGKSLRFKILPFMMDYKLGYEATA